MSLTIPEVAPPEVEPPYFERFPLGDGSFMWAHHRDRCVGPHCSIHNPSEHPLTRAGLYWRSDRGIMERICSHGVGHPDPDDLAYKRSVMDPDLYDNYCFDVHGCDGCCR